VNAQDSIYVWGQHYKRSFSDEREIEGESLLQRGVPQGSPGEKDYAGKYLRKGGRRSEFDRDFVELPPTTPVAETAHFLAVGSKDNGKQRGRGDAA